MREVVLGRIEKRSLADFHRLGLVEASAGNVAPLRADRQDGHFDQLAEPVRKTRGFVVLSFSQPSAMVQDGVTVSDACNVSEISGSVTSSSTDPPG